MRMVKEWRKMNRLRLIGFAKPQNKGMEMRKVS